jgi:hypothetical protein
MTPAKAIVNNNTSIISWKYEEKIPNCLGFAVYRTDLNSLAKTPLPSWVGFEGGSNQGWKPKSTEEWPIQKFSWKDLTAEPDGFYQYSVTPMIGTPGSLQPAKDSTVTSPSVHLCAKRGSAYSHFNRGILSTQFVARQVTPPSGGGPDYRVLGDRIDQPRDPLRESLAGDFLTAVPSLLNRAKETAGQCYAALYELSDTELLEQLVGSPFVHLILSNTGTDDAENRPARQTLHESNVDIVDRLLPSGHIGHNKFMVLCDSHDTPTTVLTGSTNWTATGLCAQSNNCIIIESTELAAAYLDYWNRLKQDGVAQGPDFRSKNNAPLDFTIDQGETNVRLWFSPNTQQKSKPSGGKAETPSDMMDVFTAMEGASQAILFLAFQPGTPSIIDQAASCQQAKLDLYIRGAVTDPKAVKEYNTDLYHRSGDMPDGTVVAAAAVEDQFGYWEKELLKSSPGAHAIIHDKIVVIDPFSPNRTVITGSHNLGFSASYNNDENLLIIRGNQALAESYAAHVLDVYDHYRWRYIMQQKHDQAWNGLKADDSWQDKYFSSTDSARKEFQFWFG